MSCLLMDKETNDVTFIVDCKRFFCHKAIMAARSEYFRALLYGDLKESHQSEIELKEISAAAFEMVLTYIYTGVMDLKNLGVENVEKILDILLVVHQYQFEFLLENVTIYLKEIISDSNIVAVFAALKKARLLSISQLEETCCKYIRKYIDNHADEILLHKSFVNIAPWIIEAILCRKAFFVEEIDLFRAVHKWILHNRSKLDGKQELLKLVRLPLISSRDLINEVLPSKLFSDEDILGAMEIRSGSNYKELNYRGCTIYGKNVATEEYNSHVTYKLDFDGRYKHVKVIIKLGKPFVITCVKVFRNSRCECGYGGNRSQFHGLEKSHDGKKWIPIHICESQIGHLSFTFWFSPTLGRQFTFRVKNFDCISCFDRVECMYSTAEADFKMVFLLAILFFHFVIGFNVFLICNVPSKHAY